MIAFSCAHCGLKLSVKDEFAGRRSACPTCKQPLIVPALDRTQASVPAGPIDGQDSSLGRAGIDVGVTLAGDSAAPERAGRLSVRELLARRGTSRQRYVIESEIARGGMGAVLRAVDCDIRREVAVKYLLDQADVRKKARFVEEAQITGQLEHPNIVPIHELGVDGQKHLFFSMKMVKGRSLAQVLDELRSDPKAAEKQYPLRRRLSILISVCHALAYAHARGVVHRDLKPANIMVGDYGEVYVMDWGLAKVLTDSPSAPLASIVAGPAAPAPTAIPVAEVSSGRSSKVVTSRAPEADLTQDGAVLGTPVYMPPEQARGQVDAIDTRSDVYSLGAILYEMLTLLPPIDKDGGYLGVLMRVVAGEIAPPEKRAPKRAGKMPRELSAIALKALAKEKERRYPSVEALRRDIELFQEGRSVSAKEDSKREVLLKFVKRNKGFSFGAAMTLLVVLASFGLVVNALRQTNRAYADYKKEQEDRRIQARKSVSAFVRAARLAVNERNFPDALVQLDIALEYQDDHAQARLLKAQVLVVLQRYSAAAEELDRYRRLQPHDVLAAKLGELVRRARVNDMTDVRNLADLLGQQRAYPLDEEMLRQAQRFTQSKEELRKLYVQRIEKAWPGRGQWLMVDPRGQLVLYLSNYPNVKDLLPLKDMRLDALNLENCDQLRDLSPLHGMPLSSLNLTNCRRVQDLAPLRAMPLTTLTLQNCMLVSDLAPLHALPLTSLNLGGCAGVKDLSPLHGMKLTTLYLVGSQARDLTPLRGLPLASITVDGQQMDQLPLLRDVPITVVTLVGGEVRELAALRGMKLTTLIVSECARVEDLRPLQGMPLTTLSLAYCSVRDLTPLRGMALTALVLHGCNELRDLTPLRGMKLTSLSLYLSGQVQDLTPLQGMPLTSLDLSHCNQLRSLTALRGMPLTVLHLNGCAQLSDLSPLRGMPLQTLSLVDSPLITDLSILQGINLQAISLNPQRITRGLDIVRRMRSLRSVNNWAAPDFWKKYDAGEFSK